MANIRDNWKTFKKSHPSFEKNQKNKLDLGPHLDAFDKAEKEIAAHCQAVAKAFSAALDATRSISVALQDYRKVVDEAAKTDKSIKVDFGKVGFDDISTRIDAMKQIAITVAKVK